LFSLACCLRAPRRRAADAQMMTRPQCRPSAARQGTRAPTRPTDRSITSTRRTSSRYCAPRDWQAPSTTSKQHITDTHAQSLHYTTLHCSRPRLGIRVRVLLFFREIVWRGKYFSIGRQDMDKAKGDTTTKDDDKALAPSRLRQCGTTVAAAAATATTTTTEQVKAARHRGDFGRGRGINCRRWCWGRGKPMTMVEPRRCEWRPVCVSMHLRLVVEAKVVVGV